MKGKLHLLEGAPNGFIVTNFLESEVESRLTAINNVTMSLTGEGNQILNRVRDIVSLPSSSNSFCIKGVFVFGQRLSLIYELALFNHEWFSPNK